MVSSDQAMTYAIGDLHGEVTLLKRLLALLPFREEDTLVFLGDYLDRGEDSIATILALRELQRSHAACVFLRGNHDDAWLECWDGSRFTHPPDIDGAMEVWDGCDGQIPFEAGYWLEETRIEYEDTYAYYVHAGVTPGQPVWRTAGLNKMWGVKGFFDSDYDWGKPVVFGHKQLPEPLLQPNKIGIDTGAYRTGRLTAVRLPDRQLFEARR
ncbi:MAG TPA: metallophosphoesterase [Ktedonobacterales bacterium]|nr:metallophosphoesterase [Ktedonobacterales bacterium]